MEKDAQQEDSLTFNPKRERVATQCVCCGSRSLQAAPAILMPFIAHRCFGWAPAMIDESWGLNTVKNGMAYSVCKSLQCSLCNLLFLDIRFSNDELFNLYYGYRNAEYTSLRESYEPGYTLRNDAFGIAIDYFGLLEQFLDPLLPNRQLAILDWGGDSGKNTPLRQRAMRHDVYDISRTATVPGITAISYEQAVAGNYDLIVCSNVLEHVPYPSDVLLDIRQAMRPDSLLYVEVPYEDILRMHGQESIEYKKHWHEHVNFFSPESITRLLKNMGLSITAMSLDKSITAGLKSSYIMQFACKKMPS
jgi:SAM-dependent methyltransferase